MAEVCSLSCKATLEDVRLLADFLQQCTQAAGIPEEVRIDLELALVEAANNIVIHGCEGLKDQTMVLQIRSVRGGIELAIEDHGRPIPPNRLGGTGEAGPEDESGRGLSLIAACIDRVNYASSTRGNRLVLFKAVPCAHQGSVH